MSAHVQKPVSDSKLLFPKTSLIPEMFLNIIPNLSGMSWLTVRSPSGQRGGCSSMSSTAKLLLYLNDRPSCELKTLNCFWRSKGQSPNSGRIGSFGLWALQCKSKSIFSVTASLCLFFLFFLEGYLSRDTMFVSHLSRQISQPFPPGKTSLIASS